MNTRPHGSGRVWSRTQAGERGFFAFCSVLRAAPQETVCQEAGEGGVTVGPGTRFAAPCPEIDEGAVLVGPALFVGTAAGQETVLAAAPRDGRETPSAALHHQRRQA